MTRKLLGRPSLSQVARRHSRMLVGMIVLGALAGAGLTQVVPPTLSSSTLVLLPTAAEAQVYSEADVATQTRIAMSATVLGAAGATMKPPLQASQVLPHIEVTDQTEQLLQITATSTTPGQAAALAGAVTDAYLAYVNSSSQAIGDSILAGLRSRVDALEKQQEALTLEITRSTARQQAAAPGSPQARSEAQILAQLQSKRTELLLELNKVQDSLATSPAGFDAGAIAVQQPSVESPPPLWRRLALWMPGAGVLLAAIALAGATARARRQRTLRLRDEIAVVAGSPVLGSLRTRRPRSTVDWSTLLSSHAAGPAEDWAWRRTLNSLPGAVGQPGGLSHPRSVIVVSMAGDRPGLALAAHLAAYAAGRGALTRFTITIGQQAVTPLWTVLTSDSRDQLRENLLLGAPRDRDPAPDLTLTMVVVNRTAPDLGRLPESSAILLAVSSGAATEDDIVRLNLGLDTIGRRFDGVVVADPDHADQTTGQRDIATDAVSRLPIRITGTGVVRSSTP